MKKPAVSRRDVDGIVLLDKPGGLSSNHALQRTKHLYRARKAGHSGTLDPLATGLLVVCLGQATKVCGYVLEANKRYRTVCKLGVTTDSGDADGVVLETREVPTGVSERLEAVLNEFRGDIEQYPPMYSALKHNGQRLYRLARQGIEVEREPRRVVIHALTRVSYQGDRLELDVTCSKGTYVRSLVEDIGLALGCGAHVEALRRLGTDPWMSPEMLTLDALEAMAPEGDEVLDRHLLPVDSALSQWPALRLEPENARRIGMGQVVVAGNIDADRQVRLYSEDVFLGMGRVLEDGRVAPQRMMAQPG